MKKSIEELVVIVEGLLFAANEPLSAEALAKLFIDEVKPKAQDIKKALNQLKKNYQDRGIELCEVASGFRFQVAQTVVPYIAKTIEEKPARYSRALLETLALIAYRQPITRGEIEDIRGVVVSSNIIKTLDEQGWIRVVGHKEVPGKPALYATTKSFLDHFGLKTLEDLPPLAALKDFESLNVNFEENPVLAEDNQLELDIEPENEMEEETEAEIEEAQAEAEEDSEAELEEEIEAEAEEAEIEEDEDEEDLDAILDELLDEDGEKDDALA
ncbi:MAG: SMC-Scp complex subunit ScpB [Proteobacteria bacterium]|nr:SMC-Scp complex subunit ScpB [Pseudomonadota bacterium]